MSSIYFCTWSNDVLQCSQKFMIEFFFQNSQLNFHVEREEERGGNLKLRNLLLYQMFNISQIDKLLNIFLPNHIRMDFLCLYENFYELWGCCQWLMLFIQTRELKRKGNSWFSCWASLLHTIDDCSLLLTACVYGYLSHGDDERQPWR